MPPLASPSPRPPRPGAPHPAIRVCRHRNKPPQLSEGHSDFSRQTLHRLFSRQSPSQTPLLLNPKPLDSPHRSHHICYQVAGFLPKKIDQRESLAEGLSSVFSKKQTQPAHAHTSNPKPYALNPSASNPIDQTPKPQRVPVHEWGG